ncbi:unnamed protein product [Phytomonas sp. Hart1]|nr:unnamed protein product [Phytomonas sp. Hart1]|eukprot:CCW66526.1 unnamed protein product [Phytomonas sp. isolate Hart1]
MSDHFFNTEFWLAIVKDIETSSLVREGSYIVYESLSEHKKRVVRTGIIKAVRDNVVTVTRPFSTWKTSVIAEEEEVLNAVHVEPPLSTPSLPSMQQHLQRVEAARESVSKILNSHISEIYCHSSSLKHTYLVLQAVVDIMCIPISDNSSNFIQGILQEGGFIQQITSFDANSLSQQQRADVIQLFENSEILKDESALKVPQAIMPLLEWIHAQLELFKSLKSKEDFFDEVSMFSCRSHWNDSAADTFVSSSCQVKKSVPSLFDSRFSIEETLLRSAILNVYSCNPPENDPVILLSGKLWRPELMECLQRRIYEISTRHTPFYKDFMTCNTEENTIHEIQYENSSKLKHDLKELEDKLTMQNLESCILSGSESKVKNFSISERVQNEIEEIRDFHEVNELLKSHYYFVFQGDGCMTEMNNMPKELQKAFTSKVAQCCGVPLEHIINVRFTASSLRVDFDVLHSTTVSTDLLRERLCADELSILCLFNVNLGRFPIRVIDLKEDTCGLPIGATQPKELIQTGSLLGDASECKADIFLMQQQGFESELDKLLDREFIDHEQADKMVYLSDALDCVQNILQTVSDFQLNETEALPQTNMQLNNDISAQEETVLVTLSEYLHRFTALVNENKVLHEKISSNMEENKKLRANNDRLNNELREVKDHLGRFYKSTSYEPISTPSKQEAFELVTSDDTGKTQLLQVDQLHISSTEDTQLEIQHQADLNKSEELSGVKEAFFDLSGDLDVMNQIFYQRGIEPHNLAIIVNFIKGLKDEGKSFINNSCIFDSLQKERVLHEGEETPKQFFFSINIENIEVICNLLCMLMALYKSHHDIAGISLEHDTKELDSPAAPHDSQKGGIPPKIKGEASTLCPDHSIVSNNIAFQFSENLCEISRPKADCGMCAQLEQNILQYKHYCHRIQWCYTESKKLNDLLLEQVGMLKASKG